MLIIGVAGGSGSGKTTFADLLAENLADHEAIILRQDSYYRPFDGLSLDQRKAINFDHPESLDFQQLLLDITALKNGQTVQVPNYSFADYTRSGFNPPVAPPKVLIVEGILIFAEAKLRPSFDIKIFIDADDDDRLMRRIQRDTLERRRDLSSVLSQYRETVKPMHLEFVEPSKRWADLIIPHGGRNHVGVDLVRRRILSLLQTSDKPQPKTP
ncbi:MAG: uridine kinase [Candidatus Omnitrophica bacterium]|nr:uridine kinase [Candidatus Omnitrophota bacterium]